MKNIFDKNLMAALAYYEEDIGNISLILRYGQEDLKLNKSIKSTVNSIGRYYALDLKRLKDRYSHIIKGQNLVPIPMDHKNILIPVKTRKPKYKNDGAFSYINIRHIEKIEKNNYYSKIILNDKRVIQTVSSYESTMKHYRNGLLMKTSLNTIIREDSSDYDFDLLIKIISQIKKENS